ncbi:MAG: hypothetical protein ABIP21_01795 [Acidimicrobiia bacterium]
MATPTTIRAASRKPAPGAAAAAIDPATNNSPEVMIAAFRPARATSQPATSEPMIAPIKTQDTSTSSESDDRWKSFWMKSCAPPMTPVS